MNFNLATFRETLYKIPFSQDSWKELISLVKTTTDSPAGIMMITRDKDHDILSSHSPDFQLSQEVRCAFEESEWMTAAMPENWEQDFLTQGVVLGTDIVPQEKMRESSFYQNVLNALGLEYLMAGVSLFGDDYRALIKFFRTSKQENYSRDDASFLATLMPEIRQMMRFTERLYERLVVETAESKAGAPRGAANIIVNIKGEVVHANSAAEDMLKAGKILNTKQNALVAANDFDRDPLAAVMANALGSTGEAVQDCALVGKTEDLGLHQLLALPVPPEKPPFPWMEELKVAAIVVIDPMRRVKVNPEILRKLYNITPAELELVNAMANGIKPVQYASQVNKSVPTVQSQRQSIFQKVGVNSQIELMSVFRDLTTSFEERVD